METTIWKTVAIIYSLVPMVFFCWLLYLAHYKARNRYIRALLYAVGGGGTLVCLWYFILAGSL